MQQISTKKEYKTRHDWAGKVIHWGQYKKFEFDHTNKWYLHNLESVVDNETPKLLWDFEIQTDHLISTRRHSRNLIKRLNIWTVSSCKILGNILEIDEGRTPTNGLENKKPMMRHKTLHSRDDLDRLYMSSKEGGRRLASIENSVDVSMRLLEDSIKNCREDELQRPETV